MKKRIFMLALVVGVLLSVCASAWADNVYEYFEISDFNVPDTVYDAKVGNTVTIEFDIIVKAYKEAGEKRYKNANLLKWTVGDAAWREASDYFDITSVVVTNSGSAGTSTKNTSEYIFTVSNTGTSDAGDSVTNTLHIAVTGTIKATGNLQVKASLYQVESGEAVVTETNQNNAEKVDASEQTSEEIPTSEEWGYAEDPANPEGDAWDGQDPTFTSDPGDNSQVKAKAKVSTSKLSDFEAGKANTAKIEFTGPVTEIDVYIAAKDAQKLWPDDEAVQALDKKEGKIQLTKDNILAYNIPFRITSYDFKGNEDKLTGDDSKEGKKTDKDTAKKMTSSVTLAFNGGYFSHKGFPLTFSVTNSEMKKPATKTFKINVKPNTTTPEWWYWDTRHNTTSTDTLTDVGNGELTLTEEQSEGNPTFTILSTDKKTVMKDAKVTSAVNEGTVTYTVSGLPDGEKAIVEVTYDYEWDEQYQHVLTKKDKPEVAVALTEEGTDLSTATPNKFYMSGDYGPFNITEKGSNKNEAITVNVVQPKYNYRGEANKDNSGEELEGESGYVEFSGSLALGENKKEIKVPVTLTLLNPTVKKKAAAKVTVYGKIPAYFDEKKFPASEDREGANVITTKNVEVGKVPSVKAKAAGSKNISYFVDETTLEELNAIGLSFDEKKGAVVAYPKGSKATKPTMDEEGNFSPLGIYIYATNGVGEPAVAFANVGITGGKPKISTKEVKFSNKEHVEGTFKLVEVTIKNATSADVKYSVSDEDASTLEGFGLALIQGSEIEELVSDDTEIKTGDSIEDTETDYLIITKKDDGSVKATLKEDTDYTLATKNETTTITISEKITDTVYLRQGSSEQSNLAKYKNKAAIIVRDASAMADGVSKKQINITASNIGSSVTGKVKLTIEKAAEDSDGNSSARNAASSEEAAAKAKTSSAGSKNATLPDGAKAEGEDAAEETAGEGTLTVGAARTAADLTAEQQAFLAAKGYKVIAVLPEVTADADGQYDLDEAELDEDAPEDAKLIWIPFPKNAEPSEDDEIVDFYDEAGAPVEGVPASHKVIASPWLRENVTYEPVIAIEAE